MEINSDAKSATGDAHSATEETRSGGACKNTVGDANTAKYIQSGDDANSAARTDPSDANSAGRGDVDSAAADKTAQTKTIPLRLQKVPAMFKPPLPPQPKPAVEAPATPSATYKAIRGVALPKTLTPC